MTVIPINLPVFLTMTVIPIGRTVLQTGADTWGTSWLGSAGEPMLHKTSSAVK